MRTFDFDNMPIVEIANDIIIDAVNKNASDIHFDPSKDDLKIRIRIDGILSDYGIIPKQFKRNMISRIKMIAGMNIMETRLPQDGAIKSKIGDRLLDLRVSSLPTNNAEKIVIRILDYSMSFKGLFNLGFSPEASEKIDKMLKVPNGIILVTGATGTGKSTTVYSMLQELNTEGVNIITAEDPIEMDIAGINQVQVNAEIGLTFATILRSVLRQDPNIIMIGEIRDTETAVIAVRASITGHLVLSTLHTNDSLTTIERLIDMDVERYLLGSSLTGIVSQRLARRVCPECKILKKTTEYEKSIFKRVLGVDVNEMYVANKDGCEHCTHGYRGRLAILEVLLINEAIKDAITNDEPKQVIEKLVYKSDVVTLLQDGLRKVIEGETTFEEILKIIDLDSIIDNYNFNDKKDNIKEEKETPETLEF
ncbi:MAG: GspE/PulE family protein [Bacilli bacterium]